MSSLSTIRILTQDTALYQKEEITVTDGQLSLQLYFFPVVSGTVIITGTVTTWTLDEDNGVITFDSGLDAGTLIIEYKHVLLLDASIQALMDLQSSDDDTSNIRLAAADCLDAIASSQALIQKKIKLLDLETDGPALAKALRDHAATLRKQVFSDDFVEADFDVAEQVLDKQSWVEKVRKDYMRLT